jgi:hypothetical protein
LEENYRRYNAPNPAGPHLLVRNEGGSAAPAPTNAGRSTNELENHNRSIYRGRVSLDPVQPPPIEDEVFDNEDEVPRGASGGQGQASGGDPGDVVNDVTTAESGVKK